VNESIAYLSASDLRDFYRRKALSPVEVTHAILDRIERLNPVLNAFTIVTAELALNQARAAERAYAT
jgi:aspartyl-tRNA(Asn)/glutamyl-tRNA(Gln) amidotransferase subunit A